MSLFLNAIKQFYPFLKPYFLKVWESKPMQKGIIPSFFTIGFVASIYFISMFAIGCESVNQGFVKVVEIHAKELVADYEKHLKHPENPLFVGYEKQEDGHFIRIEKPIYSDREKIIESRFRSAEELLRVIKEQQEEAKEIE